MTPDYSVPLRQDTFMLHCLNQALQPIEVAVRGFLFLCPAYCPLLFYSSRPEERSGEDVDIIVARLKNVKAFERFRPSLLHQICLCGFYECLEKGITCKMTHRLQRCIWRIMYKTFSWHWVLSESLFSFSISSRRHWDQLVCSPVWFTGCQSFRDIELSGTTARQREHTMKSYWTALRWKVSDRNLSMTGFHYSWQYNVFRVHISSQHAFELWPCGCLSVLCRSVQKNIGSLPVTTNSRLHLMMPLLAEVVIGILSLAHLDIN